MRIVRFKDGTYSIRRLSMFGWQYLSLDTEEEWWGKKYRRKYSSGTFKEVQNKLDDYKDVGEIVK